MSDPKRSSWSITAGNIVLAIVAALALYVGAYLWMVRPITGIEEFPDGSWRRATAPLYAWWPGKEADAGVYVDSLFDPIYRLDRLVRPNTWKPPR